MKHPIRQKQIAAFLSSLTVAAFFAFFIYMSTAEHISVFQQEQVHNYSTLTELQLEMVPDDTAPVGVRKVYRGNLDADSLHECCLCFNIAHHHIQVYIGGELVYSLTGAESNRIGQNVSSNWCTIPIEPEYIGQTITVVLTPLFEAAMSKTPEFLLGSHYAIAMDLLGSELPLLILSALCILLGIAVFAVSAYYRWGLNTEADTMAYLGLFSVMLGLWKITDLRFTPLLMPEHAMALGYISIGALFLTGLCLLLYFSTLFGEKYRAVLWLLSLGASLTCLAVLGMQVLGITEIRQNLVYSHAILIAAIVSIPAAALYNRIVHKNWGLMRSCKLLFLLLIGIALDLALYYRHNDTGTISFAILGFIIYTLIVFLGGIQSATQKAYTDSLTGLSSRLRWNELMDGTAPLPEPFAVLLLDLNGLKRVNDTLGHEAGDRMIFHFANILRNTLPGSCVICRWGGDEFSVLLTGVSRSQLDGHIQALHRATEDYNAATPDLPIHFAIGSALSAEHPAISRAELFRLADEEMYRNKQLWYTQK